MELQIKVNVNRLIPLEKQKQIKKAYFQFLFKPNWQYKIVIRVENFPPCSNQQNQIVKTMERYETEQQKY